MKIRFSEGAPVELRGAEVEMTSKEFEEIWFVPKVVPETRRNRPTAEATEAKLEEAFSLYKDGMNKSNALRTALGYAGGDTYRKFNEYIEEHKEKRGRPRKRKKRKGNYSKASERMKFIHQRMRELKEDGMRHKTARKTAIVDWNKSKSRRRIKF